MKIHTFGDSHAVYPWERLVIENVDILMNSIKREDGMPKTCYRVGTEQLNLLNITNYGVNENDIVVFCFGETDCRFHVHKFKETYKELIDKTVENYFITIKLNIDLFKNLNVLIEGVPPIIQFTFERAALNFPILGHDIERKKYSEYFNYRLKEKSKEYDYEYLDVYELYLNEVGYMNTEYSDTFCHITNPIFYQQEINKKIKKWSAE